MELGYNYTGKDIFGKKSVEIRAKAKPTADNINIALRHFKKDRENDFVVLYVTTDEGLYHQFLYDTISDWENDVITYVIVKSLYEKDIRKISFREVKFIINELCKSYKE